MTRRQFTRLLGYAALAWPLARPAFIVLLGGAAAWPISTQAQHGKVYRVGFLTAANPEPVLTLMLEGLRDLGYVDGQNILVDVRLAHGEAHLLPSLAADLLAT